MKYLIILILLLLSCLASNTTNSSSGQLSETYYDGCQYVTNSQGGLTHKGNCSNSVHR